MTDTTTAAATLADRARAAWTAQQETDRRDAAEQEAARIDRVRCAANYYTATLDIDTLPGDWTVRPPASALDWAPDTADTVIDGLRLTYERHAGGTLLLTWRCPVPDCGANRQTALTSLAALGHAIETADEPPGTPGLPWFCAACQYRGLVETAQPTPEPAFAEQLEQLVRRIARDEIGQIQEPPF